MASKTGIKSVIENNVNSEDTVIGLSASGNTPFVTGALQEAKRRGAATVGIISNPEGTVLDAADVKIPLLTGPEVISGSTRMKAATAQKMTVNMISTTSMIKLGRVTGNFMTAMSPTNAKLRKRAKFIIGSICNISEEEAELLLQKNNDNIRDSINAFRKAQNSEGK
jgi:N-acetylmuramic acid 6-phosphate etherase